MYRIGMLLIFALATTSLAAKKEDPVKDTAAEIKKAVGKGDVAGAQAAFAKAEGLKGRYDAKKLKPVVDAIAKGTTHKQPDLALSAVQTLGKLQVKGSSKALSGLLKVPNKPTPERLPVHLAAIKATGEIHDEASLKGLEKLLAHPNTDTAVTAADSISLFTALESKNMTALLKRLTKMLADLEKKLPKTKKEADKTRMERVRSAINAAMAKLAGVEEGAPENAQAWEEWLKQKAKSA